LSSGDFKTSYEAEIRVFQTWFVKFWLLVFFLGLLVFPFMLPPKHYYLHIVNMTAIAVIGAIGMNLIIGFTGQFSFGQHAFLAIGAYGAAIVAGRLGLPFYLTIPLAGCLSALAGLMIGVPSLRLKGLYLAMATLAFAFIVDHFVVHLSITGASNGISVPRAKMLGLVMKTDRECYFLIVGLAVLMTILAKNLVRTKVGRAFVAIRDYELAASIIGVNLTRYKLSAFTVSSFYVGVAGALYAYYMGYIAPEHFTLEVGIEYIAMIIVGGLGSILGSIFGAAAITLLPELLRFCANIFRDTYPILSDYFAQLKLVAYGFVIVMFLVFEPDGLYGRWIKIKTYWKLWPFHS